MTKFNLFFMLVFLYKSHFVKGGIYSTPEEKRLLREAGCNEYGEFLEAGACIPYGYRQQTIPDKHTTKIFTTILNENVREVDDKKEAMTVDLVINMQWVDERIRTNFSSGDVEDGGIGLDLRVIDRIWRPYMYFRNLTDYKGHSDSYNILSLKLLSNSTLNTTETVVCYTLETKATVYCDFDFTEYPTDIQLCRVRFGSKSPGLDLLLHDPQDSHHLQKNYEAASFDIHINFFNGYLDGQESYNKVVGYDVAMERKLAPFLMMYYWPCITIVAVSQISFVVPLDAIPGRISLLVTLFLTLTNVFIHEMVR